MTDARRLQGKLFNAVCEEKIAFGLGCFSIGLGLAQLLAPQAVAFVAGVNGKKNAGLIRLFGLREIAAGIVILAQGKRPAEGVWMRVAGDALDLTCLAVAATSADSCKVRLPMAIANIAAITALDVATADKLSQTRGFIDEEGRVQVNKSIFINKTPQECYEYWRNFENLPSFMRHLCSVDVRDDGRSTWVAQGPAGAKVTWEAEILEDHVNEEIVWRSLPGSLVGNRGSVKFATAPGERGTYVRVNIEYEPPAGMVGVGIAKLFREEPKMQLNDDLRRFKQIMEIGEIMLSDSSPSGNGNIVQHPAQPSRN